MSAITTPANRRRFCVWLAGLGRSLQAKAQAHMAAEAIWVDLQSPVHSETQMSATTTNKAGSTGMA